MVVVLVFCLAVVTDTKKISERIINLTSCSQYISQYILYMLCCVYVLGSISVADDLDFEVCKDYYLTVEAWDSGNPPLSTATMVTIELMDVNDNAPAFSQDIYNVLVSEDASVGQTITRVISGLSVYPCFSYFYTFLFHTFFSCVFSRYWQKIWTVR